MSSAACLAYDARADDNDKPLILNESVQSAVLSQLKSYKPGVSTIDFLKINDIQMTHTSITMKTQATFAVLDNGLWGMVGHMTATGSNSGAGQGLSMCGLVLLLNASQSSKTNELYTAAPIGKLFLPFGIRSTVDTGLRRQVTSFETTATNICSPAPGAEFSYAVQLHTQLNATGLFGQTKEMDVTYRDTCRVGDARPASEYGATLQGQALPVTCERVASSGAKSTHGFAFLIDAGFYIEVGESNESGTGKIHYEAVSYTRR
jgi:hypothetical protein